MQEVVGSIPISSTMSNTGIPEYRLTGIPEYQSKVLVVEIIDALHAGQRCFVSDLNQDLILKKIMKRLTDEFHPEKAYLFGSKAREDDHCDSRD